MALTLYGYGHGQVWLRLAMARCCVCPLDRASISLTLVSHGHITLTTNQPSSEESNSSDCHTISPSFLSIEESPSLVGPWRPVLASPRVVLG